MKKAEADFLAFSYYSSWTVSAVISGFLIGGRKMAIWQACTLIISTLIYWPFARKYDKILVQREAATLKKDEAEGK